MRPLALLSSALLLCGLFASPAQAEAPPTATKGLQLRAAALAQRPGPTDERIFWLHWRAPGVVMAGLDQGNGFALAYQPVAGIGPVGIAAEPLAALSGLIPTVGVFGPRDPVRLRAGVIESQLGHGTLLADFTNAPPRVARSIGLHLDGALAGLGAELMIADMLAPSRLVAGRAHVRPFLLAMAPDAALLRFDDVGMDPRTEVLGALVVGGSIVVDSEAAVTGAGVDAELALLDLRELELGARLDLNMLSGAAGGTTGSGVHGSVQLGLHLLGALDVDTNLELYTGGDGYVPRYFDRLYMLERVGVLGHETPKAAAALPASVGARARVNADVLDLVTVKLEVDDRLSAAGRDGRVSAGAHLRVPLALFSVGGGLTLAHSDIDAFAQGDVFAPGFLALSEVRMAAFLDVLHVVGQMWVVHRALESRTRSAWEVGGQLGLEVHFGLL